jgi:pimeloyl-ACP methyl ester carboxylesterase
MRRTMASDLFVTDRGRGPVVLAIHGQPGLSSDWDDVMPQLVGDHRMLVPDRPGYGRSAGEALAMAENAEILADMLVERGAVPATIVGHSYGGGIALLLAARRPEVVSGLVLVASVGQADSVNTVDHVLALPWAGEVLAAAGMVAFGKVLPRLRGLASHVPGRRLDWLEASLPDRRYVEVTSGFGRQLWRSFVVEQRALVREIGDVEAVLSGIRVPTVVIAGTWDVVVPPSVAAAVAAAIPGAQLTIVARTGHFVPRDAPRVVAEAVRRVEARVSAPDGPDAPGEASGPGA